MEKLAGLVVIVSLTVIVTMPLNFALALTDAERYNSGYSHGCSDARTGGHPYLNSNPTHTSSFMGGYNVGYSACSGSSGQQQGPRINWGAVCKSFQGFIKEPCNTLTTPDGFTLTKEGERVVACFVGGGLATIFLTPAQLIAAKSLAPAVGCG